MTFVLCGNFSIEPVAKRLKSQDVALADFNDYIPVLTGLRAKLTDGARGVICLIDGYDLAADALFDNAKIVQAAERYCGACAQFSEQHPDKFLIPSTFALPLHSPLSNADMLAPNGMRATEMYVAQALSELGRTRPNVLPFDLFGVVREVGEASAYAHPMRYHGRFGFSGPMLGNLSGRLNDLLAALTIAAKKVIAIDFDNTLWGGVVGETGPLGVTLSQDGKGRAYRHFQAALKQLAQRGVLLVGLSKNNPEDVEELFARNEMMALKRDDFVSIEANWNPKPQNLAAVASRLSLGLDSFVFIDDSPFERESMRQFAPEVASLDMPVSPADRISWLLEDIVPTYFFSARLTKEDLAKTAQYKSNTTRAALRTQMSEDDFIKSLEIELRYFVNEPGQADRLAQMCAKTNQFNLTTKRYSLADISRMISSPDYIVASMSYSDKFGDEGVIGLAIVNIAGQEIDTFLMSCRVIGRGAEQAFMEKICALAREKGVRALKARFIPTKKNIVAADFLECAGFAPNSESGAEGRSFSKEI